MKKNKAIALALCALLCAFMALSVLFFAVEAHHDCSGESCHICRQIETCVLLMNSITLAAIIAPAFFCICCGIYCVFRCAPTGGEPNTLVSLKVKLTI